MYEAYISTRSIMYVNKYGGLQLKYCPFQVIAKVDIPPIHQGQVVLVEAVKVTPDGKDVYIIDSLGYFVIDFRLHF